MTFQSRRDHALELLAGTGIWRSNYHPPYLRALWSMGVEVPPPHFVSFYRVVIYAGAWFGLPLGAMMWLLIPPEVGVGGMTAIGTTVVAGLVFALTMALYYAYGRKKHRLPEWESLGRDQ